MIQTSTKRLSKIKKKLKKNQTSDYQFLISSLQRESNKQNYTSNYLNAGKNSLKNSVELKKSSMINSIDNYKQLNETISNNRECSKIIIRNNKASNPPIFENVKFLKNSRVQQDEERENKFVLSTQGYQRNIELSQKNHKQKGIYESGKQQKSNKFTEHLNDTFEQKFQAYVEFVNEFIEEMFRNFGVDKSTSMARKKCLLDTLGKQLLREINKNIDLHTMKALNKSIEVSNFMSFPSKVISRQLQRSITLKQKPQEICLKKIIDELSYQNTKLTQLISEHEGKNIKMFIKMNQNESKEIQRCKKYLSTLFDKYKLLEKSLVKENQKYRKVCEENKEAEKKVEVLEKQNLLLTEELERTKAIIEEMQSQTVSKLSFEEDLHNKTIFNFNLIENNPKQNKTSKNNQSLSHQQSQQYQSKMDRSFITKRDKASSCLSTHLNCEIVKNKNEEIMSCSTITKTKNMKKKKQPKVGIGINLKDQFNEIIQDELTSLRKQVSSLKQKLNEETVLKLALQKQLSSIESTLRKRTEKTEKMQTIINQQMSEIQKLMQLNTKLTNQLRTHETKSKVKEKEQKQSSKVTGQISEQITKLNHIKAALSIKNKNSLHAPFMESEYRIIAMQAGLLQNFLNEN